MSRNPARVIAEKAGDRRVVARGLPFDLALVGALGGLLVIVQERPFWIAFTVVAFISILGVLTVISTSRALAATKAEERGKRSDDKALAKVQRSLGCLPILLIGATAISLVVHLRTGSWPWQPWVVVAGGLLGHLLAVGIIRWSRSVHEEAP